MATAPKDKLNETEYKKLKEAVKEQITSETRKSRMAKNEQISAVYKQNARDLEDILGKM